MKHPRRHRAAANAQLEMSDADLAYTCDRDLRCPDATAAAVCDDDGMIRSPE